MENKTYQEVRSGLNRLVHEKVHALQSPIERAMVLIGDKYSIQILNTLKECDRVRFVELEEKITGISPRTLSARLKHLEFYGLIERFQHQTIPPKVEYNLTEKGKGLSATLDELSEWADKWFPHQNA